MKVIWNNFVENGDIYKSVYKGRYCKGCESDKQDSDLVNGKCPDHPTTELELVEEENYFFNLTKYKDTLLSWIDSNPTFLEPANKLEELKNLIIGSRDISISRTKQNCPWGINVPNDDNQVIYCWFDAIWNYAFAAGYLTDNFKWDRVINICGPDILRFHGVIFQSFLQAEGIKNSSKLLVHGTILDKDGVKISKSIGNVIDPIEQLQKYGVDAVRYYSLAGLNTYGNSSWNEDDLKALWNSQIVNDWGNLISRVLHLIDIKLDGRIKTVGTQEFSNTISDYVKDITNLWDNFKVRDALLKTNELVKFGNKYINDVKPWSSENYSYELTNLYLLLTTVNEFYIPLFGVEKYQEVEEIIKAGKKEILYSRI